MDEQKQTLWQSLTDWESSPVIRAFNRIKSKTAYKLLEMRIDYWFSLGRSYDRETHFYAAKKISEINGARAVPYLIEALKEYQGPFTNSILSALVNIGEPSIPGLVRMMKKYYISDTVLYYRAVYALDKIGIEKIGFHDRVLILLMLKNEQEIIELGSLAVPELINALDYPYYSIRERATSALVKIKDASSIPALVEKLKSEDLNDRNLAIYALGQMNEINAVPGLIESLVNEDINELKKIAFLGNFIMRSNPPEKWEFRSADALESILKNCKSLQEIHAFEKKFNIGYSEQKTKHPEKLEQVEYQAYLMKLRNEIAKRRDMIARDKDILLDAVPQPPKRGTIYSSIRKARCG